MNRKLSVLVVDDSLAMRGFVAALLRAEGHAPTSAADGEEGLRTLQSGSFDLVLTDILMPEKDGLRFIEELRLTHPFIPIVAFSGGGHWLNVDYCLQAARSLGATMVLPKPFDRQQLVDAIETAVNPSEDEIRRLCLLSARHEFIPAHDLTG
jgi:CheY-like chemotaxis protein